MQNLTAIENVEALLWPTVLRTKEIEDRAIAALRAVDVLERKDHYPSDLSGGEAKSRNGKSNHSPTSSSVC